MRKSEWIEEREKEIEHYDKSLISHCSDNDYDLMKDYEWSLMHHSDDDCTYNDYDSGTIKHFQD